MRQAFSKTLVELAKSDPKVLLITGDHGYALFDEFRRECPEQYINAGIAEQNMVGMAAGLSRLGFRPFVYGLSAFVPIRVLEQIKIDIAHDNLPVVLLGDGAGFVYSHLGTSHQATEDLACTRSIPNLTILSPSDRFELASYLKLAHHLKSPVYFRMGKSDRGDVHRSEIPRVELGKLVSINTSEKLDVALIATGSMVKTAFDIGQKYGYPVWSVPSIKPINENDVIDIAKKFNAIVVIEEHTIYGGLGARIAEISSKHAPAKILCIGVQDRFSHYCGSYDYLLKEHGLDAATVEEKIIEFIQ